MAQLRVDIVEFGQRLVRTVSVEVPDVRGGRILEQQLDYRNYKRHILKVITSE